MGLKVYDLETLAGLMTYTDLDVDTQEVNTFIIHKSKNQYQELIEYLKTVKGQIGFNNLIFDYTIIHKMIKEYNKMIKLNGDHLSYILFQEAEKIISKQNEKNNFDYYLRHDEYIIPQLDLFKIWHYNNKAKSTSLKALEISMNYPNVMEGSIDFKKFDITEEDIESVLIYNLNDVKATYRFYQETVKYGKLDLRRAIRKKYKLECFNWNNGRIGEQLILKLYCDRTGLDQKYVKQLRSPITQLNLKDCIPKNIILNSPTFNLVLKAFESKVIDISNFENKSKEKNRVASVIFKGCRIDYGLGGVHGVCKPGIYKSDEKRIIKTADVGSLYPNLPIVYEFFIKHLGIEFLNVYRDNIVNVRMAEKAKPKNLQDMAIVDGLKEAANIPYGKSNEINSFLYDPEYTMKTTVAGQLVTSMLVERLGEIPECELLMFNTDGFEISIPREYEEKYLKICSQWENETKLKLEYATYEKMWIADVNNYGCVNSEGKIKNKGRFEIDKVIGNEPAYYKDNSFRIVPLAIFQYFVNNIPVEDTIKNHFNKEYKDFKNNKIYDFCGRQKFKSDSYGQIHEVNKDDEGHSTSKKIKQQKNVRYYISNNGSLFTKTYLAKPNKEGISIKDQLLIPYETLDVTIDPKLKDKTSYINKGFVIKVFNEFIKKEKIEDYDINFNFYIKECYKEIHNIENKQITMF